MFKAQQWNPMIWLNWWYKVTHTRNGDTRIPRAKVFQNNIDIFHDGAYRTADGTVVTIPVYGEAVADAVIYSAQITPSEASAEEEFQTEITVVNEDCVLAAKKLVSESLNPAMLNMASLHHPGGGVIDGSGAQEESLCRRSNLSVSLYQFSLSGGRHGDLAELVGVRRREGKGYPMDERFGGIYSPEVCFFRDTEDTGYSLLEEPFFISVISVAAINYNPKHGHHRLNADGRIPEEDIPVLKDKIRTILNIGISHGHDSLVLGAFGCGAFCTPPAEMAALFREVFSEKCYKNRFRKIVFAIIDDRNSFRPMSRHGNFAPFREIFTNNNNNTGSL